MNNCKGIFGKIFGHKFVSKIIEKIPPERPLPDVSGYDLIGFINSLSHKKYKIICKRCGLEK